MPSGSFWRSRDAQLHRAGVPFMEEAKCKELLGQYPRCGARQGGVTCPECQGTLVAQAFARRGWRVLVVDEPSGFP
jgi:hypothetical protein